jgi:LemA protein
MRAWALLLLLVATTALSGCGYNRLQQLDEGVKASWSEVVNQYQRRSDLIPNLVATVKGFAIQEQQVLIGVTEARARASSIQLTPELINDPQAFARFQQAQGQLTQALKSLFAVTEAYPNIKSDQNFRDLQAQIEGTENRITVARNRYIDAVREYNTTVRQFPTNLTAKMFDFSVKPNFSVANEAEISTAQKVDFGNGVAPQARQGAQTSPAPPAGPEAATPPPARAQ